MLYGVLPEYPIASDIVDGRVVRGGPVDNVSSISASLYDWEVLKGIREVSLSQFVEPGEKLSFYSIEKRVRTEKLAAKENADVDAKD